MNLTLRRVTAALLALWSLSVLLPDGGIGWTLLVLVGSWLLWRRPTAAAPIATASPRTTPTTGAPMRRALSPAEPVPYWFLPAAAAGAAAVLHDREQPAAADSEEPVEDEELCDPSYDAAGYGGAVAADVEEIDDPAADLGFGGFGGGGSWGDGDDFGGFGGGGDFGDGDDG